MTKADTKPPMKFGWCIDRNHDKCPGLLRPKMGVWAVTVCHCRCHGDTLELPVKRSA